MARSLGWYMTVDEVQFAQPAPPPPAGHVPLRQARRRLVANGQWAANQLMGRRWPPFCLQHPQIYRPSSIKEMLRRSGYESVDVRRSKNYFPVRFLASQALWAMGVKANRLPLPGGSVGLKLGNILTMATR